MVQSFTKPPKVVTKKKSSSYCSGYRKATTYNTSTAGSDPSSNVNAANSSKQTVSKECISEKTEKE